MKRVACKDCLHFREAPYDAPRTGCWHPAHMLVTQKEAFLDQQQAPGNHRKINLRGNCASYEGRARPVSWWRRIFALGA
jgi:hypothetical protein